MYYGQYPFLKKEEDAETEANKYTSWWQKFTQNKGDGENQNKADGENQNNGLSKNSTSGYIESDTVKALREQMESHGGLKPGAYTSQWQPQIDAFANDIINRKEFQYDVNADALYNQYKDRYINLGQKAMMDTMGQAAQLTGGYGNSYAQMAGQQAYQTYLQGLTDKIPELAQLAQARYDQQGQDLYQKYGLLNTQEQNAYNNWLNGYNQWLAERDYITGRYDTERGYDYGVYRDAVADAQWQKQFEEDLRRYNLEMAMQYGYGGGGYGGGGYGGGSGGGDDDYDDAYTAYYEGLTSGSGISDTLSNMSAAGFTDKEINSAKDKYQQEVVDPLRKPTKTQSGTK